VARRANPQLPTGKTPFLNSTMKTRIQNQTIKRANNDTMSSTIVTPAKQRRAENISAANTSTVFKTSMIV